MLSFTPTWTRRHVKYNNWDMGGVWDSPSTIIVIVIVIGSLFQVDKKKKNTNVNQVTYKL